MSRFRTAAEIRQQQRSEAEARRADVARTKAAAVALRHKKEAELNSLRPAILDLWRKFVTARQLGYASIYHENDRAIPSGRLVLEARWWRFWPGRRVFRLWVVRNGSIRVTQPIWWTRRHGNAFDFAQAIVDQTGRSVGLDEDLGNGSFVIHWTDPQQQVK